MNHLFHHVTIWDREAFLAVNHGLKCPALDWLMPRATDLGLGHVQAILVVAAALIAALAAREIRLRHLPADIWRALVSRRWWVAPLLVAIPLSGLTTDVFKLTPRLRPAWFFATEQQAGRYLDVKVNTIPGPNGDPWYYPLRVHGFPSGHTTTSIALAVAVTILFRRRRRAMPAIAGVWALAILISLSRIYLAAHWPLDVMAGVLFGIFFGVLSVRLCEMWARSKAPVVATASLPAEDGQTTPCVS